jgi:hypothetical protein
MINSHRDVVDLSPCNSDDETNATQYNAKMISAIKEQLLNRSLNNSTNSSRSSVKAASASPRPDGVKAC